MYIIHVTFILKMLRDTFTNKLFPHDEKNNYELPDI